MGAGDVPRVGQLVRHGHALAEDRQARDVNYQLQKRQHATEATAYFVLEHQPRSCDELPPNGLVTWSNITVEVNNKKVAAPSFKAMEEEPICGSKVEIVSPEEITLSWDAKAAAAAVEEAA